MSTPCLGNPACVKPSIVIGTTQALRNPAARVGDDLLMILKSPDGLMLGFGILGLVALSLLSRGGKKRRLATGHFAGAKEKGAARIRGREKLKQRELDATTLYIGKPEQGLFGGIDDSRITYLTDAPRGFYICGGPGSGKSKSVVNQLIYSAIDQGLSGWLYDFKFPTAFGRLDGSSQTEQILGYAEKAGYHINIFAPGFPESDVCNPLDFLRSPTDSETAQQLAIAMNRNFKLLSKEKEDPFFSPAGDQLCTAVLMLAKSTRFPDIMMCQAILSMEKIIERVQAANIDYFIKAAFGQIISSAKSEKTVASIISTANLLFTRFIKPSILPAFCGPSSLPLDTKNKQLTVFGMDRERRDVVGPLLASVIHMIVNHHVCLAPSESVFLSLDEVRTLYLPHLVSWPNENRSDGLITIVACQNNVQLEEVYGIQYKALIGGLGTKVFLNPQEIDAARMASDLLGEEEIRYKQRSRGISGGKRSVTISEQERTRKLFEPSQFLKLPTGHCIIINPGYQNKEEAGVPFKTKIKFSKAEIAASKESVKAWPDIRDELIAISPQRPITEEDVKERYQEVDRLFPLPASA